MSLPVLQSLDGRLRIAAIVAGTPPPGLIVPALQSIDPAFADRAFASDLAA